MSSCLSVAVIDSDRLSREAVEHAVKPFAEKMKLIGGFVNFQEAMKFIPTGKPHVVILEVRDIEQGVNELSFITTRFPGTTVVVIAADKDPDWILRLIRAGATEYLMKPLQGADLEEVFKKLTRFHTQANVGKRGTVFSVYNPCGGMGTTTIAVNLATALAAPGKKVALVDLNLLSPDVTTFLDLTPRYTLTNIAAKLGQIDASFLRSILVPHPSGVHVLNGPSVVGEADGITPERLQEVIALLQDMFKYIVIDTGGQLPGCNLGVFAYSDHILFNTVLHQPAIRNAKRYFVAMHNEGIGEHRLKLVVNRHIARDGTKIADVEKLLGTKVYQIVPNVYAEVKSSIYRGAPLASCYPRSPVVKAMDDLAQKLMSNGHSGTLEMQPGTDWHTSPAPLGSFLDRTLVLDRIPGSG